MKEENLKIINKKINDVTIRMVWDSYDEKYYVSVVDVIEALTKK